MSSSVIYKTPKGRFEDGDYSVARATGPLLTWLDRETRAQMYRQPFEQEATLFVPTPIGAFGPGGSYLIEETEPSHAGCGVVRWSRLYAAMPPAWTQTRVTEHTYQFIQDGDELSSDPTTDLKVITFDAVITARVLTEWFQTPDVTTISIEPGYRLTELNGDVYVFGTPPSESDEYFLGENQEVLRWRGNWWYRTSVLVPNLIPSTPA